MPLGSCVSLLARKTRQSEIYLLLVSCQSVRWLTLHLGYLPDTYAELTSPVCVCVAVTSTCNGREAVLRCLSLGATEYLIQPLRVNELLVLGTRISHGRLVRAHQNNFRVNAALEAAAANLPLCAW